MANRFWDRLFPKKQTPSWLRFITTGSFYKISDMRTDSSIASIRTQVETMRALAADSQISTALSYYATDATVTNQHGEIIWATPASEDDVEVADIVNQLFLRWNVNEYARDHILELATIGNLYLPTTDLFKEMADDNARINIALDNNTIVDSKYDIVPSYKIPPETVLHLYKEGEPYGFIVEPEEETTTRYTVYPESSIIHFSLGGLLGDYNIDLENLDGKVETYDIKFAQPLMDKAVQPTQTLGLLEDAYLLSSLSRVVRFVGVECGDIEEEEIADALFEIKDMIEQQFSLSTATGDAQSYMNPQSPNNLIYLPMQNGSTPISITDLSMGDLNEADNKLLDHYQDKKLSVLGVPKEAMNFSSNEGLGGAGSVLSQRSQLYSNALERIETAYKNGWKAAINKYFQARNMSGMVDRFELNMQPIITPLSTVISEKRDLAVGQAAQIVDLLKSVGVKDKSVYKNALSEILGEEYADMASTIQSWDIDVEEGEGGNEF